MGQHLPTVTLTHVPDKEKGSKGKTNTEEQEIRLQTPVTARRLLILCQARSYHYVFQNKAFVLSPGANTCDKVMWMPGSVRELKQTPAKSP